LIDNDKIEIRQKTYLSFSPQMSRTSLILGKENGAYEGDFQLEHVTFENIEYCVSQQTKTLNLLARFGEDTSTILGCRL
jgi:hypothetical protein